MRKGPVSSRVALLLRSAEGKPFFASISQYIRVVPLAHAMQGMIDDDDMVYMMVVYDDYHM